MVGWPQSAGSVVYNAISVLRDGGIETTYRKRELPNYAVFDERRHFDVDSDGVPCVVDVDGVGVGVMICEDLWFPASLAQSVDACARVVQVQIERASCSASACPLMWISGADDYLQKTMHQRSS